MSKTIDDILNGTVKLFESTLEQAVKESDEVTSSLEKIKEERISKCDHGLVFDETIALKLIESTPVDPNLDPAVAFVMGSPAYTKIRKKFPRLDGPCPKGCGFHGIAYASYAHYIYGDW